MRLNLICFFNGYFVLGCLYMVFDELIDFYIRNVFFVIWINKVFLVLYEVKKISNKKFCVSVFFLGGLVCLFWKFLVFLKISLDVNKCFKDILYNKFNKGWIFYF